MYQPTRANTRIVIDGTALSCADVTHVAREHVQVTVSTAGVERARAAVAGDQRAVPWAYGAAQ